MADKPRPIIPLTTKSQLHDTQSRIRGTLIPPRPIIPLGVAAKKPSILKAWFAGVIENIPYTTADQAVDDITNDLSRYKNTNVIHPGNLYDIRRNLTLVAGDSRVDPVTVRSDTFNPVYKKIAGVLSSPGGDRNLRDLRPAERVSDNSTLSAYYEMVKRRSAGFLSRGQTSEMTDALFAEKLYSEIEGIESALGSSGSLRQGFRISGEKIVQGKRTRVQVDNFLAANLFFSTARPMPQALGEGFNITRGGGTHYSDRISGLEGLTYASHKGLPGYQASPGALRYLVNPYDSHRFKDFYVVRHELGHAMHEEIKRVHRNARASLVEHIDPLAKPDITSAFVSDYKAKASDIVRNLGYPPSFGGGAIQESLIIDTLINAGIRQSLDKSILSSSERKRGDIFASIMEHAFIKRHVDPRTGTESTFDTVRVLGDFINPSMTDPNSAGAVQMGENVGRLLAGSFSRKQGDCRGKRSAIYDEITFRWI